jgi:hypothetical protein
VRIRFKSVLWLLTKFTISCSCFPLCTEAAIMTPAYAVRQKPLGSLFTSTTVMGEDKDRLALAMSYGPEIG